MGAKVFECKDDDFMIQGQDLDEIMKMARMHLKDKHGMDDISDDDLMAKIREV